MTARNCSPMIRALGLLISTASLFDQSLIAQSGSKCSVLGTPQVNSTLVQLKNETAVTVYERGKPIHVALTLRAGAEGVYLPDFFGAFEQTCSHGFDSEILTLEGKTADPIGSSCGYAGGTPRITYVELKPGETRTWSTDLKTASIAPGHYCLYAEYLSSEELIGWAINLPEKSALIAKGRITAEPILVEIR